MSARPSQVVVAFDFSRSAEAAMHWAVDLARRAEQRVFHFACIIDAHAGIPGIPADDKVDYLYADKVQHQLAARIEAEFTASQISAAVQFFVHARFGRPATEILVLANGVGADLIVTGSMGMTGVESVLLGSVSEAVVRGAGCSVMVARPKSYADVELLTMIEVEPSHHYVPPHRYSYEETRMIKRPDEWPLY